MNIELGQNITAAGYSWTAIKKENGNTYFLCDSCVKRMEFGNKDNYGKSDIRIELLNGRILYNLKKEFGDNLVSITLSLKSMDGLNDYGTIMEDDELAILNIDLYRECREYISKSNQFWLATSYSTPSGVPASYVLYVDSGGYVDWGDYDCSRGVRPFFILKSNIFES